MNIIYKKIEIYVFSLERNNINEKTERTKNCS